MYYSTAIDESAVPRVITDTSSIEQLLCFCSFQEFLARGAWPEELGQRSCLAMRLSNSLLQKLLRDETFTSTFQN